MPDVAADRPSGSIAVAKGVVCRLRVRTGDRRALHPVRGCECREVHGDGCRAFLPGDIRTLATPDVPGGIRGESNPLPEPRKPVIDPGPRPRLPRGSGAGVGPSVGDDAAGLPVGRTPVELDRARGSSWTSPRASIPSLGRHPLQRHSRRRHRNDLRRAAAPDRQSREPRELPRNPVAVASPPPVPSNCQDDPHKIGTRMRSL